MSVKNLMQSMLAENRHWSRTSCGVVIILGKGQYEVVLAAKGSALDMIPQDEANGCDAELVEAN